MAMAEKQPRRFIIPYPPRANQLSISINLIKVSQMCQSQICSSQNVGVSKTCNFGDGDGGDGDLMRFSPLRETELKEMLDCIPQDMRCRFDRWIRMFVSIIGTAMHESVCVSVCMHMSHVLVCINRKFFTRAENINLKNFMNRHRKPDHQNACPRMVNAEQQSFLSLIKEKFGLDLLTSLTGNFGCTASTSGSQTLQLQFLNGISTPVSTGMDIKGEDNEPFIVALVDGTGKIVSMGAEAAAKVEIVVLEGDCNDDEVENWSSHDFNNKIIRDWNGKKVLQGNTFLNLKAGIGSVDKISFTHNSTWKKKRDCRLGARSVNAVSVKKRKQNPFSLGTSASTQTRSMISLIYMTIYGDYIRSARRAKIETVGDFIVCLYLNRQSLEEIFDREKHAKSLKISEKHALTCPTKLKYCSSCEQKPEVVFNASGEENAKKLVISAFENWGDVTCVDEDKSVADCSNPAVYGPAKTEMVTPCLDTLVTTYDENIYRVGLNLHINELSLFGNMLSDEKDPNPHLLPEALRKQYNEIHSGFESFCTSNEHDPEHLFGLVGTRTDKKKRFCRRWRMLVWVVTFTRPLIKRSLDDIRSPKKPRLLGGFKCEPPFGCEREDNRERDTWRMTRRHVKSTADD
ncbi:hypothetical protein OSB04_005064 [Centaurea solstitialis]|uniref:Calmodulin binding protein-like N-terminal domain-containing protein n=1 Tax=Centaurea solstitialis TaxID=347529 RepID=A0AA38TFA4_9ASTR|nr:hypothetical protein OSB04_005064 [Centaurea solstitialis]